MIKNAKNIRVDFADIEELVIERKRIFIGNCSTFKEGSLVLRIFSEKEVKHLISESWMMMRNFCFCFYNKTKIKERSKQRA